MDNVLCEPTLYTVKAILILDNDGSRIITKYFDDTFSTTKEQKAFEKSLYSKTSKANAEIILLEGLTCVYRSNVDLYFCVVGAVQQNELVLASVLSCLYDSVSQMLRKNVEKRALLDNLDAVYLAVDEICDQGIILECDPTTVVQRVAIKAEEMPLGEQSVGQVIAAAKEQIKWSLLK